MATQLTGKFGVDIRLHHTMTADIATPVVDVNESSAWLIASGVVADAGDLVYADDRVITATDSIDFSTPGPTGFFNAVSWVKLKALYVRVTAGPGTLTIGRPAGTTGLPIFSAAGDEMPGFAVGDFFAATHRALAGWAVTQTTGDIIDFTAVGGNVTVRIIAVGASA